MKTMHIPNKLYFRIGDVADLLSVKPYVLRYWETEFPDIKPAKSKSGQRLYKRKDVEMLVSIKELLYDQRFTIHGARKRLKELHRELRVEHEGPQMALGLPAVVAKPPVTRPIAALAPSPVSEAKVGVPDNRKLFVKIKQDLESALESLKI